MSKWFVIDHLQGLRLAGRDVKAFCQAQFTGDITAWPTGLWQPTAWCNPKGRVEALILVASNEDGVDLILPTDQSAIAKKLSLYSIGRQVQFSEPLTVEGSFQPAGGDFRIAGDATRAVRLGGNGPSAAAADRLRWQLADLCLPLPWLSPVTSARFLPQALGLEHNGGLSFSKGCFPGQEVIARVHYLGRVKQQLLGFEFEGADNAAFAPGEQLLQSGGDPAGEILARVPINGKVVGLAVSPIELEPGTEVSAQAGSCPSPGRMTTLDRLCYYRESIDTTQ